MAGPIEIVMYVTHANGKPFEDGVGETARRFVGSGSTVRVAMMRAAEKIPQFWPFRKGSVTKLTLTVERAK